MNKSSNIRFPKGIWGNILLTLSILLCAALPSEAQMRYGFRFGGTFADASLKNAPDVSLINRSGFSGGVDFEYQSPVSGLAADVAILYTRYNSCFKFGDSQARSIGRDFLEIPLHVKYKFWLPSFHNLVAPMVYTGPSLMFRLDSKRESPFVTKGVLPGWDAGIGFDIVNFIQITGGYRFGMGNSVKNVAGAPDAGMHTNGWNVAATILFDF